MNPKCMYIKIAMRSISDCDSTLEWIAKSGLLTADGWLPFLVSDYFAII